MKIRDFGILVLVWAACCHAWAAALRAQERPQPGGEITVAQVVWGFDGKAPGRSFVPLSVLVQNDGPDPASGTLRLSKAYGIKQKIDADFEQSYYVSGFSSKWVQLTPFVISDFENWELTWGTQESARIEIPTPRIGERATVLFAAPDDLTAAGSALRRCDPALFPVSVTGTDGLRGAVLHSAPDWQGARLQAFDEWLRRGGRVYLVHGATGDYPEFSGELAMLNDARESFRIGSGRVTRLPLAVDDLDGDTVKDLILNDSTALTQADLDAQLLEIRRGALMPIWTDFDDSILRELRSLTKFHRNWWLVYGCAALYALAVFPGSYLLGRRAADWRWFYAGFLGISVVFSAGFTKLGELGSADRSRTRSVAIAHQLADGLYDVTQFTCAASRSGQLYELTNEGSGRLYSSCQVIEPVNGIVRQQDGQFDLELPSASTCNIVHRVRASGPSLDVQVTNLQIDESALKEFDVTFAGALSDQSMIVCAWHRRTVYEMKVDGNGARLGKEQRRGADFVNSFGALPFQPATQFNQWSYRDDEPATTVEAFQRLLFQAVGTTLNLRGGITAEEVALDPSLVRLLIYRPMPDEFRFAGDQFPDQQGYVLYVVDVPASGAGS